MTSRPIESQLRRLGDDLAYPETPDIAGGITALVGGNGSGRSLRWLAVAAAAILVAIVVGLVPATREAVMSWLGVQGVRIERADVVGTAGQLDLGTPLAVEEAAAAVGFELAIPRALDEPGVAFVSGGMASFVYPSPEGSAELVLTQFEGDIEPVIVKQVPTDTAMSLVAVADVTAVWIEGPHAIFFLPADGPATEDQPRLAGNTLLWQRGPITFRLEGAASLAEARHIAESVD